MSHLLMSRYFDLPSVRAAIDAIADDVMMRRTTVMIIPANVDAADIWSYLRRALDDRSDRYVDLTVSDNAGIGPPIITVGAEFDVWTDNPDLPHSIDAMQRAISAKDWLPTTFLLSDLSFSDHETIREWVQFVQRWAKAQYHAGEIRERLPGFCAVVPMAALGDEIPQTDVQLAVHWWWGIPSLLDLQLLCSPGRDGSVDSMKGLWRQFCLPSVTGGDIRLLEHLWDRCYGDMPGLVEDLQRYAEGCGWETHVFDSAGMIVRNRMLSGYRWVHQGSPPADLAKLWAIGACTSCPEIGPEIHSAILARAGHTTRLEHRVWRGQTGLVLPLLDAVRLELCEELTEHLGPEWPTMWEGPLDSREARSARENPATCQWGHLSHLIEKGPDFRSFRRQWLDIAQLASHTRNEIAHYRPVPYERFERLVKLVGESLRVIRA